MRGDGKRNFLGIVMGGCGRYVFFSSFFFFLFLKKRDGRDGGDWGDGKGWRDVLVQKWNGMMMFDV